MDKFKKLVSKSNKYYKIADHLIYVTYQVVGEIKLLLTIAENLYRSCINAMNAFLHYERLYKRIMVLPVNFNERFHLFATKIKKRQGLSEEMVGVVRDLKNIMDKHKESAVEFARPGKYIISSNNYKLKTLDINLMKKYAFQVKHLISKLGVMK